MASYKKIGDTGIEYSKENLLGKGTFGAVYLGIYNGKQVAVKKILLNRSENEEREVDPEPQKCVENSQSGGR
jgi:predicted Ser/Thr protein kinase